MNTEAAMELQMRLAKEALAMLVIHPTFDVQLYRESIMEIGEAWELPADATLEALALIEHERLAIQKAGEGGVVQHILPEEELPMHATGTETLDIHTAGRSTATSPAAGHPSSQCWNGCGRTPSWTRCTSASTTMTQAMMPVIA